MEIENELDRQAGESLVLHYRFVPVGVVLLALRNGGLVSIPVMFPEDRKPAVNAWLSRKLQELVKSWELPVNGKAYGPYSG